MKIFFIVPWFCKTTVSEQRKLSFFHKGKMVLKHESKMGSWLKVLYVPYVILTWQQDKVIKKYLFNFCLVLCRCSRVAFNGIENMRKSFMQKYSMRSQFSTNYCTKSIRIIRVPTLSIQVCRGESGEKVKPPRCLLLVRACSLALSVA